MKFNDAVWGALFGLLGAALVVDVQGFPAMPGQHVGPALFPGLIGVGFAICGAILVIRGLGHRRTTGQAWVALPPWLRAPRQVLGFAVLVGVNLLYLLAGDRLGFVVGGFIYLAALMAVLGVRPIRVVPIALLLTLAIHFCFYRLLRVPLPWGILQPVAW